MEFFSAIREEELWQLPENISHETRKGTMSSEKEDWRVWSTEGKGNRTYVILKR